MAGTRAGGEQAAQTNRERYDEKYAEYGGFYKYIGTRGGAKSKGGGFAKDKALARRAGKKGGKASARSLNR